MEVDEGNRIFKDALSNDEWLQVPSEICKKLEAFLETKFDELLTSKALYEAKKAETEHKYEKAENDLTDYKNNFTECQSKLDIAQKTITELESQISMCTSEVTKLQETCNRLESTTAEFRRQRDMAIDERDSLTKMLDRRNAEIERLQTDVSTLSNQLNSAVNSKCEALAKMEEVSSLKVSLEYKERHMEQEKAFLNNQIRNLSEDLNKRAAELQNLRHEHTTSQILLETKLTRKSEELRIATENIQSLMANNKQVSTKAEELNEKLKQQRDTEIKLQESFNNELLAQTRLAELYKGMSDENNSQIEELKKGITELQSLLRSASDQYGELETKHKEAEVEHDEILSKKNECIVLLKKELDTANDMLKMAKEENLHREIESLSPSAATASRLMKTGTSLTSIYSQLVTVSEELSMEKEENRRLNAYIGKIIQEFEDKTPLLQKEREEYDHALETLSEMTKHNENMINECHRLREECCDAKKGESRALRENERMKKEIVDLSRQVCFLLKEVESCRTESAPNSETDIPISDSISSSEIISKKLVTFRDIEELQNNNIKLLEVIRELTSSHEEAERMDPSNIIALKDKISEMRETHAQMLLQQEKQNRMLENVIRQRDTFRNLCQKSMKLPLDDEIPMDQSSNTESDIQAKSADRDPEKEKKLKEIEDLLESTKKELSTLKEEYETYKKEKCANEKILVDQIEQLQKDHRELIQINCKLTSMTEYNDERFKILKQNTEVYKNQINALEEKNKTYNNTIIKHEQSIMHLKDEALNAQTKLSRAEVSLQNLQQECRLLRDSEARLLKEKEMTNRETHGQTLLLNNLELIKASLERSEAEGKMRLETRLDEAMRECSALRRRLQEEQDKFRELGSHLELQTKNAQQRMEEEKQQADHFREELGKTREELTNKALQIEELSKKIKNSMLLSHSIGDEQRTKELERQLNECQEEITLLKQQVALSKENIAQYCNIAECAEKELKDEHERNSQFKESAETQLKANVDLIANLKDKIGELEAELSLQSSGQAETTVELKNQLSRVKEQLLVTSEELNVYKADLDALRLEMRSVSESAQVAEDKYAREMMLHSSDLQALSSLKEELVRVQSELNETRHQREQAVEALNLSKAGWEEREKLIQQEKDEIAKRLKDLDAQNAMLYDQIQALSTQLSVVHAQHDSSFNKSSGDCSFNRSMTEDEVKSSEQLLKIIKFIRKEKDLAITKFEVLQAENLRLKSQFEMLEKEFSETKSALAKEREGSEASMVTATKHSEVLRKVETLNAITDSNKILRDERDTLKMQLREVTSRMSSLEDQLAPLQEKNREMSVKADTALSENQALRAEATRWRQRANVLIEKANKISPEDWRRLQNERESLAKLLSAEKDAHKKLQEECNNIRQEKSRFEEQINTLSQQNRNQAKELKRQSDELNSIKAQIQRLSQELIEAREIVTQRTDENSKITEDLASKEIMLTDIRAKETQVRKIAKKYKTQYEELAKAMEEEKRKNEEKLQAPPTADVVPPEIQEQFRQEGREELEQRITELETSMNERLNEVTTQVSSALEENEKLKKENTVLKNTEVEKDERIKVVLKSAKMKISVLREERNKIKEELNELKSRMENNEQSRSDNTIIARIESERDKAISEKQQERDRLTREIETLTQRINQLQRQHGLPPASKPSTSSGSSEKSGSEPPTANIKPMSGHSNTQQQSATVMPWRGGETPFASIRPMSQLRTVAVLPTSQNAGNSSPSTAVLVPPQQQIVHTTGNSSIEVMSSSPTSSHTDYMPATSSASPAVAPIRQVAVPPTQQATIGMSSREDPPSAAESTQDMETETENQQPIMQQQQQAVAMVLPRVEQQSSSSQTQNVEQSSSSSSSSSTSVAVVASSQQASSSNTVTTTQAGLKRPRETEGDSSTGGQNDDQPKVQQQAKRTRTQATSQEHFQVGVTESGVEVEYQVPTSSQRDQEDDVIVLSEDEGDGPDEGEGDGGEGEEEGMMEADDDGPFEESADGDNDGYEMEALAYHHEEEVYDDVDCQDMEDSEPAGDADDPNNEVEIIEDSSEVPNQSGSSSSVSASAAPEQSGVGGSNGEGGRSSETTSVTTAVQVAQSGAPQSEAISSGSGSGSEGTILSQAATSNTMFPRNRNVTPLSRQQQSQLLLPHGFEEIGDDGIVPSTPTLYVPRRTDGFGEAVSSPHVPSGRFTFSETSSTAPRNVAQTNEAIDDTRVDLSQLDDSGTGRSVPSTPLQVSPQGEQQGAEGTSTSEVGPGPGPSVEQEPEQCEPAQCEDIPLITITETTDEAETSNQESSAPRSDGPPEAVAGTSGGDSTSTIRSGSVPEVQDEELLEGEEGADGVSSEGEKAQTVDETEIEEGREAEASETPSTNTRQRSGRGVATARRSSRLNFRARSTHRPTPIVWNAGAGPNANQQMQQDISATRGRGINTENPTRGNFATRHRARRMRQTRPFGRY